MEPAQPNHDPRRPANASCVSSATKFFFTLQRRQKCPARKNWSARLCAPTSAAPPTRRREIIAAHAGGAAAAGASWRDLPMQKTADGWQIELPLAEVGYLQGQSLSARRKKLAALARRPGRGHFRPSQFRAHRQHHLLRLHAAFRRDQKSRLDRRRKTGSATQIARSARLRHSPAVGKIPRPDQTIAAHRRHSSAAASCICCRSIRRRRPTRASDVSAVRMPRWI